MHNKKSRWDEAPTLVELGRSRPEAGQPIVGEERLDWDSICTDPASGTSQFAVPRDQIMARVSVQN